MFHCNKTRPDAPAGILDCAGDDSRLILVENIMKKDLERDGVQTALYRILACLDTPSQSSCVNLRLPDTVLIDKKVITHWFNSGTSHDGLPMIVDKPHQKGIQWRAQDVLRSFGKKRKKKNEVIAQFLSRHEDDEHVGGTGKHCSVEYLDFEGLEGLLTRRTVTGILQRFIAPPGKSNEMIRVIWTPSLVLMERCRNNNSFRDKALKVKERVPTYDGPPHACSFYDVRAQPTIAELNIAAVSIREHVLQITRQRVDRMVLFFKVGEQATMWFTHATSIRLASMPNAVSFRPIVIGAMSPLPDETVEESLSPENSKHRCVSCTKSLKEHDKTNLITMSQAARVFSMCCRTEEYKRHGTFPKGEKGHQISTSILCMRRAVARGCGDALLLPQIYSTMEDPEQEKLEDDEDLLNKAKISPVLRLTFPDMRPDEIKAMRKDPAFMGTQCSVCTSCFLMYNDPDLPRTLGILRNEERKRPRRPQHSRALSISPTKSQRSHTTLRDTKRSESVVPTRTTRDTGLAEPSEVGRKLNKRHQQRQEKRRQLGLCEEEFSMTRTLKVDRDKDGRLTLPCIGKGPVTRIGMEWD